MRLFAGYLTSLFGAVLAVSLSGCGILPGKKVPKGTPVESIGAMDAIAVVDGDTAGGKPSLETTPDFLKDARPNIKSEKKKKSKKTKVFLGYRVKKGYARTGRNKKSRVVETFHYLKEYEEPDPYAPERYFFDLKDRKLKRTTGTIDPGRGKILHGPYKKTVGGKVQEEGYFYVGTKHLRWERYNKDFILLSKIHYEKGYPRDATVKYYDAERQKVKEVIPIYQGEVQGLYMRYYENGQLEWQGKYDKGRKVGVWTNYYSFRKRKHYDYQFPESAYEPPAEPELLREYDRHGNTVYEKGKLDKRAQR